MQILPETGRIDWIPDASLVGPQFVLLKVADDRGAFATQGFTIDVFLELGNRSPVIISNPAFLATQDETFVYDVEVYEPDGDPVTIELETGPAGVILDPQTGQLSWTPQATDIGTHRIRISALDAAGAAGQQSWDLEVRGPNTAPQFTTTPLLDVVAGGNYFYDAHAIDAEDNVSFLLGNAPAGMTIDSFSGVIRWQPNIAEIGENPITVRAVDERGAFTDQPYVLNVTPDTEAPLVSIRFSTNLALLGEAVTVHVMASDNVDVTSLTLAIDGVPAALDAQNRAVFTPLVSGPPPQFVASATDAAGNVGTATRALRVLDPNDNESPEVEITSPGFGNTITYLADIVGTVTDDNLELYRLEFSPLGTNQWTTIQEVNCFAPSTSCSFSSASTLGTFDPTMLANDAYDIRLFARDVNGLGAFTQIELNVEANAKLGNFRLEYTDLEIPLAGVPIRINRIYDTLESQRSGDFGFGWQLGVADARIRETLPLSQSEQLGYPSIFGATPFRTGTRVYLTNPDGKRVGFTFDPQPIPTLIGRAWTPRFTPDPGVFDTLEVDNTAVTQNGDGTFSLYLFGLSFNPDEYRLTTKDGTTYRYNQFTGIRDITDRNGNVLTFTDAGIFSSFGESIQWLRDAQGRITEIIDPAGNSLYYDYERGDLISFTDQVNNVTTMSYFSSPAHYLDEVIDPLGNLVSRTEYDENGRVAAVYDALGNPLTQEYDLANNREVVADRLGYETTYAYDNRGNVTSTTDPVGSLTSFVYDFNDNIIAITNARGHITQFTYDALGNATSTTDALGGTTTVTYDTFGNMLTITDALGRLTTNSYDPQGNLTQTINAGGDATTFTYDNQGRVLTTTDPLNYTTTMQYGTGPHPTRVTAPDGTFRQVTYNALGLPALMTAEDGSQTQLTYDAAGKPISVKDSLENEGTLSYEGDRLVSITDRLGRVTSYQYDAIGNRLCCSAKGFQSYFA